jgi:nucleotide-binding universal stress UspA family protein
MRVQHILFPTDFSDLSKATEPHVRRFASHFGSRVTVLHAVETPSAFYGMPPDAFFDMQDASTMSDQAWAAIQSALPDLSAERIVRFGDPAAIIAEFAGENSVDLIMMPTHGYGTFRRALIGSVTAKTLHDTECPVWTMAHEEKPVADAQLDPTRIVCAIDLAPESVQMVKNAATLSASFGAQLWLAHILTQVDTFGEDLRDVSEWALNIQRFYEFHAGQEIAKIQTQAGTNFPVCIHTGPVAATVADIARKHEANLVITGRGSVDQFLGAIRSHTYPIIHEAPCPVLTL